MKRVVLGLLLVLVVATAGLAIYLAQVPETTEKRKNDPPSRPAKAAPAAKAPPVAKAPPAAKAHSGEAGMRGLNPIVVLVEELPPAAATCGVGRDAIQVATELRLSQSPLQIVKSIADAKGYFYVQVNVIAVENICAANIYASFRTGAVVRSNNQLTIASVWSENLIGAAWKAETPQKVSGGVDTLTQQFIDVWTRDNP